MPRTIMNHARCQTGQVMTEYTVALVVMVAAMFIPVDGTPLYIVLANAIRSNYAAFSAAISIPVTPL